MTLGELWSSGPALLARIPPDDMTSMMQTMLARGGYVETLTPAELDQLIRECRVPPERLDAR